MVAFAPTAQAHRLDEYLQATRIDISSNRVDLEIDLTPGVEVVSAVLSLMDTNRDGNISSAESDAYAQLLLKMLVLQMDQQRQVVKLDSVYFPPISEMKSGTGIIQLKASAEFAPVMPGSHQLFSKTSTRRTSAFISSTPTSPNPRGFKSPVRNAMSGRRKSGLITLSPGIEPGRRTWPVTGPTGENSRGSITPERSGKASTGFHPLAESSHCDNPALRAAEYFPPNP